MTQNTNVVQATKTEQSAPQKKYASQSRNRLISNIVVYIVLIILSIIWLYPIIWVILQAFRVEYNDQGQLIGSVVSHYFPKGLGFENFKLLFTETQRVKFLRWVLNTLMVAVVTTIFSTALNLSTSYVMSKMKFKARKPIMNISMILGLFPGFMSMIAIYYILKGVGLISSTNEGLRILALMIVYSAGAGMGFHFAKGYFDTISNSLIESARIDGATHAKIFVSIILPLSKPIIIYTALMTFMGPWMDFIFARVILGPENVHLHTTAVGLYYLLNGNREDSNVFTMFCAGCLLIAVPIVTLFIAMQKFYVEGITAGSVKG